MSDELKAVEKSIVHMLTWAKRVTVTEATQPARYVVEVESCDAWRWSKDYEAMPTAAQVVQDLTTIQIGKVEKVEPYAT